MKLLNIILHEAVGMFVDDGAFALAIVLWLVIVTAVVHFTAPGPQWGGGLLFGGLTAILIDSTVRRARARK